MAKKVDPIRSKYYKPLENTEKCVSILYYLSALFSFAPLFIAQSKHPNLFIWSQILFSLSVITVAVGSITVRLYLSPKAQERRYKDFLSHAFATQHYEKTKGYYNNSQNKPLHRIAAQILENSFYSKSTIRIMTRDERIKVIVYILIWFIFLFNINTELTIIVIITQIIFSEFVLAKWLHMELLKTKFEKVFDRMFNLFNTKQDNVNFNTTTLETMGIYEMAKANSCITLSEKIFNKTSQDLDKEWKDIRKKLNI